MAEPLLPDDQWKIIRPLLPVTSPAERVSARRSQGSNTKSCGRSRNPP